MEIRLSLAPTLYNNKNKTITMAIVFQYPNGYRPVPVSVPTGGSGVNINDRNHEQRQDSQPLMRNVEVNNNNNNNNNGDFINQNHHHHHHHHHHDVGDGIIIDDENHSMSFVEQLMREICSVYQLFYQRPTTMTTTNNTTTTTTTNGTNSNLSSSTGRRSEMQDNQRQGVEQQQQQQHQQRGRRTNSTLMSRETSSSSLLSVGQLPDIIQCHRTSFSIDVSFESRTTTIYQNPSTSTSSLSSMSMNHEERFEDGTGAIGGDDNIVGGGGGGGIGIGYESESEELNEESWTFELKLAVGPWRLRQVGRDLRRVGDQLQLEGSIHHRSTTRRRSLEFRLVMKVAIPTIALVGLGYAFLRRHL